MEAQSMKKPSHERKTFSPETPRVSHGPKRYKVQEDEIEEIAQRLTGEEEVQIREASTPYDKSDKSDDDESELDALFE